MLIGYCRVSTTEQNLDRQIKVLKIMDVKEFIVINQLKKISIDLSTLS